MASHFSKRCFRKVTILALLLASTSFANAANKKAKDFYQLEHDAWLADARGFNKVEADLVKAIQNDPASAKYHYLLAHLYVRRYANNPSEIDLLKKASELAQQSIDLEPKKEYGYVILAEILDMMGQTQNALKMIDKTYNPMFEPSWRSFFMEAKLSTDRLTSEQVLAKLEKALTTKNSQPDIIIPYIIAMVSAYNAPSMIEEDLKKWEEKFQNPLFTQSRARALANQGKYQEAHRLYEQTYSPHFDKPESILNDAIILHGQLNNPKKAKALLKHILKNLKDKASKETYLLALSHLGSLQLAAGHLKEAEKNFLMAITQSDNRYDQLEFVTKAYRDEKKYLALTKLIKKLNQKIPGSGILYALLGETLSEDLNHHEQALEAFENAIVLEPRRSDFYNGMGLAYYRQNHLDEALFIFHKATKIDPGDAIARYNMACIFSRLNQTEQALLALKEAISLDPRLIDNAKHDTDFKNIKSTHSFADLIYDDGSQIPAH